MLYPIDEETTDGGSVRSSDAAAASIRNLLLATTL
jgi:hypothetical protein